MVFAVVVMKMLAILSSAALCKTGLGLFHAKLSTTSKFSLLHPGTDFQMEGRSFFKKRQIALEKGTPCSTLVPVQGA